MRQGERVAWGVTAHLRLVHSAAWAQVEVQPGLTCAQLDLFAA